MQGSFVTKKDYGNARYRGVGGRVWGHGVPIALKRGLSKGRGSAPPQKYFKKKILCLEMACSAVHSGALLCKVRMSAKEGSKPVLCLQEQSAAGSPTTNCVVRIARFVVFTVRTYDLVTGWPAYPSAALSSISGRRGSVPTGAPARRPCDGAMLF